MKVMLVNPAFDSARSRTLYPSTLLTLGSMLKKQPKMGLGPLSGVDVAIDTIKTYEPLQHISGDVENDRYQAIKQALEQHNPDVVGMSLYELNIDTISLICRKIRELNPDLKIILGGPFATLMPKTSLIETEADILIRGEAEFTFRDAIKRLEKGENPLGIPGLYMLGDCGDILTSPQSTQIPIMSVNDLEQIDLDFDLLESSLSDDGDFSPVLSRGCSFGGCSFCSVALRQKLRRISDERTVELIQTFQDFFSSLDSQAITLGINDPAFGGSKEQLLHFLDKAPTGLVDSSFRVSMAIDQFLDDGKKGERRPVQSIIDKLYDFGLREVEVGVENFSDSILRRIKCNRYTGEEASRVITALVQKGIYVDMDLILSDFKTTAEEFRENLKLLIKTIIDISVHGDDLIDFSCKPGVIPTPGTAYYRRVLKSAASEDWDEKRLSGKPSFDQNHPFYNLQVKIPTDLTSYCDEYKIGRIEDVLEWLCDQKIAQKMVELNLNDERLEWLVDKIATQPDSVIAGYMVLNGGPKFAIKSYRERGHEPLDFEYCINS